MFSSFKSCPVFRAGNKSHTSHHTFASVLYSDSSGECMLFKYKQKGYIGNGLTVNLVKLNTTPKYRFRLYDKDDVAVATVNETNATGEDLSTLSEEINSHVDVSHYIHATFIKESVEEFDTNVNISNGRVLHGGR